MVDLGYRRRVRLGRRAWANLSRSGASVSVQADPVTVNSRGRWSVSALRLAELLRAPGWLVELSRGLTWRGRWR